MAPRPPAGRLIGLLLAAAVVVSTPAGAAAVGLAQETPEPPATDNTVTRIELAADGSARWTVTIRTRLATQQDVEAYEAFQERFRENTSRFLDPFASRIDAVVAGAARVTGREMTATGFQASTHVQEVPRRWGIVTYAFTWDGFAVVEGEAVVVGDAFAGGFFLAANDTLAVVAPPGYRISAVEPEPSEQDDRVVTWTGRVDFADGRPLVRAVPAEDGQAGPADGPITPLPGLPLYGAGAVVAAVVAGVLVHVARRRSGEDARPPDPGLTDEERVVQLVESRGGRVPQAAVVDGLGWSSSKTSRVLARMADEGTIEKLQLGRENLISLPDDGN